MSSYYKSSYKNPAELTPLKNFILDKPKIRIFTPWSPLSDSRNGVPSCLRLIVDGSQELAMTSFLELGTSLYG